jgi:hypothetical protein
MAKLDDIGIAALRIAKADPNAFKSFLDELAIVEQTTLADLRASGAGEILRVQGHAQMISWILTVFRDCTRKPMPKPSLPA